MPSAANLEAAIVRELERQAQESRHGAPWVGDREDDGMMIVDGRLDLTALVRAALATMKPPKRQQPFCNAPAEPRV